MNSPVRGRHKGGKPCGCKPSQGCRYVILNGLFSRYRIVYGTAVIDYLPLFSECGDRNLPSAADTYVKVLCHLVVQSATHHYPWHGVGSEAGGRVHGFARAHRGGCGAELVVRSVPTAMHGGGLGCAGNRHCLRHGAGGAVPDAGGERNISGKISLHGAVGAAAPMAWQVIKDSFKKSQIRQSNSDKPRLMCYNVSTFN